MKCVGVHAWCCGVKEPREYEFDGRSGVSYKIELTDGQGAIEFPVTEEIYPLFEPMREYLVDIEFSQVSRQSQWGVRKDIKARIVGAELI